VKKIIKKLHLYLALALCIPLVLQGLSGSVIAFRSEISNAILSYKYDLAEGELASAEEAIYQSYLKLDQSCFGIWGPAMWGATRVAKKIRNIPKSKGLWYSSRTKCS